jgi:hypothetical protein
LQWKMKRKLRKLFEPVLLEFRSRMSIEWKLDWLLKKIGNGEYDLAKKDEDTGREIEGAFLKKLYKYPVPVNHILYDARHEYDQLVDKIVLEDKLAEEHDAYFGKYTLTIKGKLFKGYVKERRMKWWKNAWTVTTSVFALFATTVVTFSGLSEIGYLHSPKQQQEKQVIEALRQDLMELQNELIHLKTFTADPILKNLDNLSPN